MNSVVAGCSTVLAALPVIRPMPIIGLKKFTGLTETNVWRN